MITLRLAPVAPVAAPPRPRGVLAAQGPALPPKKPHAPKATKAARLLSSLSVALRWPRAVPPLLRAPTHFAPTPLQCHAAKPLQIDGQWPAGLWGALFRAGPACFEVGGHYVDHVFDAYGAVAKISVDAAGAFWQLVHVDSLTKRHEERAGHPIYATFASPPRHGFWDVLRGVGGRDPANVNVTYFNGELTVRADAGASYRLHFDSLQTLARLAPGGAHPHVAPSSGDQYSMQVEFGPRPQLRLSRIAAQPHSPSHAAAATAAPPHPAAREMRVALPYNAILHDFCLTATKAVFLVPPYCIDLTSLPFLTGQCAAKDALLWHGERPAWLIVVDLATEHVRRVPLPALFSLHHINAWDEEDGGLVLDTCAHPNPAVMNLVNEGADDLGIHAVPTRLRLAACGKLSLARMPNTVMEFPRILPHLRGRPSQTFFGLTPRRGAPRETLPIRIDWPTAGDAPPRIWVAPLAPGECAHECVPVAKTSPLPAGVDAAAHVWLLSWVTLDHGPQLRTELRVYDGARLADADALQCRLALPQNLLDFHGNWVPAGSSAPAVD